jgi:hypothetical protein
MLLAVSATVHAQPTSYSTTPGTTLYYQEVTHNSSELSMPEGSIPMQTSQDAVIALDFAAGDSARASYRTLALSMVSPMGRQAPDTAPILDEPFVLHFPSNGKVTMLSAPAMTDEILEVSDLSYEFWDFFLPLPDQPLELGVVWTDTMRIDEPNRKMMKMGRYEVVLDTMMDDGSLQIISATIENKVETVQEADASGEAGFLQIGGTENSIFYFSQSRGQLLGREREGVLEGKITYEGDEPFEMRTHMRYESTITLIDDPWQASDRDLVWDVELPDSLSVALVAYWELGDERFIELEQGTNRYANGQLSKADTSKILFHVSIVDSTAEHYIVQWRPVKYRDNDEAEPDREALDAMIEDHSVLLNMMANEGFRVRTDAFGEYQGLDNIDALIEGISSMMDSEFTRLMQDTTQAISRADPELQAKFESALPMFRSQAFIEGKLTEFIQFYYAWFGYEYAMGQIIEYEDSLPNVFGGDPIPARATVEITELDLENYTFNLMHTLKPDEAAFRELLIDFFKRMGVTDTREIEDAAFDIYDTNRYRIDFDRGWVLSMEWARLFTSGPETQKRFLNLRIVD